MADVGDRVFVANRGLKLLGAERGEKADQGNETAARRRGNVPGDVVFSEDTNFRGNIGGSVTVRCGVSLVQRGNIDRDLIIERDAVVKLRGNIGGNVRNKGGRLEHRGNLTGSELYEDYGSAQDHPGTDDDDRHR